ncbi:helix-turn-helix domain-containing protein [Olsenella sp. HMSC062G07]|uniref:AlbA family DNA-binding domain-containing protein n=1 Tax=Olsenella sp. HMSC062G07 TaxID=1739330 RepID=UPI0008A315ED|nr:ATP-binding protein [Olsenella sp. HMSC062G07]OFK23663.1 hypothetical protein HMPREF2826_03965 [Olsenella sp. HMSC062G07]
MIVVDGRTDIEKLEELLRTGTECTELDFKETLNLSTKADELHFVKDAVSMFNHYPGGYIIVGATNEGEPSDLCKGIDWKQFDGARLSDKLNKYVAVPLRPISTVHELEGHTYCLICFMSPSDGLPVPFTKLGQFKNEQGKEEVVFRPGEITRRDGAGNKVIEYSQWGEILAPFERLIREDESKRINNLIDRITEALGAKGKTPPLVIGMGEDALSSALAACFDQMETPKLLNFIDQLSAEFNRSDSASVPLTAIASAAVSYHNDEVYGHAASALYDRYISVDPYSQSTEKTKTALLISCYEIGAAIVRARRWDLVSPLVNRESPSFGRKYIYSSWLRDCQVAAINAGEYGHGSDGALISLVLNHLAGHPSILPEYALNPMTIDGKMGNDGEAVLDLLCGFDFLYCLCVFVAGKQQAGAYPSCVDFSEDRIRYVSTKIFGDAGARKKLLPGYSDDDIAAGLRELYHLISNEAMSKSKYFWGADPSGAIGAFLAEHPAKEQMLRKASLAAAKLVMAHIARDAGASPPGWAATAT